MQLSLSSSRPGGAAQLAPRYRTAASGRRVACRTVCHTVTLVLPGGKKASFQADKGGFRCRGRAAARLVA